MNMKVKCALCKTEDVPTDEELQTIVLALKNTPKLEPIYYARMLAMMRGPVCNNEKEHKYIFHEDFHKEIVNIVDKRNTALAREQEIQKQDDFLKQKIINIDMEIKKLTDDRIDTIDKQNLLAEELPIVNKEVKQSEEDLGELTGTPQGFEFWG